MQYFHILQCLFYTLGSFFYTKIVGPPKIFLWPMARLTNWDPIQDSWPRAPLGSVLLGWYVVRVIKTLTARWQLKYGCVTSPEFPI